MHRHGVGRAARDGNDLTVILVTYLYLGENPLQRSLIWQVQRPQVYEVCHGLEVFFNPRSLGQGSVTAGDNIWLQPPDAFQYRVKFDRVH